MIPTFIGLITFAFGAWMFARRQPIVIVCTMLGLGILGGSAAIVLPVLSNSSIPPARVMLGFAFAAVFMQLRTRATLAREAIVANAALIVFCVYGLISAVLLPRIFAGQINVVPMRPTGLRNLFDTFPLYFSSQNITTGVYLMGTGLAAVCSYAATRLSDSTAPIVKMVVWVTFIHAITGLLGVVLAGTIWDSFVDLMRNGSYSQTKQMGEDFARVYGLAPEASYYANFAAVWLILSVELWLRNVNPRWTGAAAMLMAGVMVISTSSTAYVSLAGYAAILAARFATLPPYLTFPKAFRIAASIVVGAVLTLALMLASPDIAAAFGAMFEQMTVDKAQSLSAQQRTFWAMQGLDAFVISGGLGIGAGSFRSSSLAMAILGGMGVVGVVTFCASLGQVLLRISRPLPQAADKLRIAVADAAGWAAVAGLIPDMVIGNSPDPGMEFAALAGISLALRRPLSSPIARLPAWNAVADRADAVSPPPRRGARPPLGWRGAIK